MSERSYHGATSRMVVMRYSSMDMPGRGIDPITHHTIRGGWFTYSSKI